MTESSTGTASALAERIALVTAIDPDVAAIEFRGAWRSWGQLGRFTAAIAGAVEPGQQVGIVLRNHPAHVGALLGVIRADGCAVTINPRRGTDRTRDDIAELGLDLLVGTAGDLAELVAPPGVRRTITIEDLDTDPVLEERDAPAGTCAPLPGVAVRMLTSGTTGPPKRVELTYATLERVLLGAKVYERHQDDDLRLRSGVAIVNSPLVHLGGVFRVLQCINDGRSFCLLEKFDVERWYDAVRRHRPRTVSLVPAALRMVLEADLDPAELSSIKTVVCGTAPLGPEDADAFYEKYGIAVLVNYAATEFGGGVAGWTLPLHQEWWDTKKGSVGRAHPGTELRTVSETDGSVLPPGEPGLLEVKAAQLGGDHWVRTTDLARIDDDGFLWILGRADQAIIRGGFKVLPDDVRRALEDHDAVREATVIGVADERLGEVPVAAVELVDGASAEASTLLDHAGRRLAPYEIPTDIRILDELPRTDSGKVDLTALRELFAVRPGSAG